MISAQVADASVDDIVLALKAADTSRTAEKVYAAVEEDEARKVIELITELADESVLPVPFLCLLA